ncbi:Subtilase-type proteinase RRT12 [Yarrowia lipolytica]|nr:Subtilase-type proteinase RRT12 [Yarrowia lipolytica]
MILQLKNETHLSDFFTLNPHFLAHFDKYHSFGNFQALAGDIPSSLVYALAKNLMSLTQIKDWTFDIDVKIYDVQANAPRHLARTSNLEPISAFGPQDFVHDPSDGSGVDIYILDTGVRHQHIEFENRGKPGRDFTGEGMGDQNGHGTHVAGLAASKTYGIAKKANIIDVKVTGEDGMGALSSVLAGLEWAAAEIHRNGRPAVINMSLGAPKNSVFNAAVEAAIDSGIPVVVAAGNTNTPACLDSPASANGVLTVGAFDDRTDTIASFSNWGQCVDIFAPGVEVISLSNQNNRGTVAQSGSSMSAPLAAGLVAYYLGMGDEPHKAMTRIRDWANMNRLSRRGMMFKPFTPNKILFNLAGEPLW